MEKRKVAVFVGSLREGSFNRQLARALEHLGEDRLEFDPVRIGDLPLYNQDFDGDYPAAGVALKAQIRAADAVLFVARWEKTKETAAQTGLDNLVDRHTPPIGAVLTQVDVRRHAKRGYGESVQYYSKYEAYYK